MPGDRKHHTEKFRRCVEKVMEQGKSEDSAYAICTTSLQEAGEAIFENAEMHSLHLCGATGQVRTEMLNGREHLVVPVVALIEGVIHAVNAETPEFVPWETIERIAESFNGKPVTLGHPVKNGKQCSANLAGIKEAHGIGEIRNSRAVKEGKKLLQEAWIDKARAKQLHPEMYQRLLDGKTEEVSVGAWVVTDEIASSFNGKSYKAQWLAGSGDHLAFLPGGRGACSVAMGCGAHRAAMLVTAEAMIPIPEYQPVLSFTTLEEKSLEDRMQLLQTAVAERWPVPANPMPQPVSWPYIVQTFDDRVIVRVGDDVFSVGYTMKNGALTLGEAHRVKQAWVAAKRKGKYEDCPTCKGTGSYKGNPCETCDGEGEIRHAALAALLGMCACTKSLKDLHTHAVKALGDRLGHPFHGNQHVSADREPVVEPPNNENRDKIKQFFTLEDHIRFEGGHWNLFGSDNKLRLGQYKTRDEAVEHGRAILQQLSK